MNGGILSSYTKTFVPVDARLNAFLESEPRLTWVSLLLSDFPSADVSLAGGTVRDALLGRMPGDIDLVVHGIDEKRLERWLRSHGALDHGDTAFAHFRFAPHGTPLSSPIEIGVSTVAIHGSRIDASFHPCDFTVNAMAWSLRRHTLYDPVNGVADLEARLLRTTGDSLECMSLDPMRILRALRLSSELAFGIDGATWKAMKDLMPLLNRTVTGEDGTHRYAISRKTIGREFLLGFLAHPAHTLHIWKESGAFALLLPEIDDLAELIETDGESAWDKTTRLAHLLHKRDLLHAYGLGAPSGEAIVAGLFAFASSTPAAPARSLGVKLHLNQFPVGDDHHVNGKTVLWMLDHLHDLESIDPAAMRPSKFERIYCGPRGADLLHFLHAYELATAQHRVSRERLEVVKRLSRHMCEQREALGGRLPKLVTGRDIAAIGIEPGPHYRDLMDRVRDAQLAGSINSKDGALEVLRIAIREL